MKYKTDDERRKARNKQLQKWKKKKYIRYAIDLHIEHDKDILDKLSQVPNKRQFVKNALRKAL